MAKSMIPRDEKIKRKKEIVEKAKNKYDETVNELERLLTNKDDIYEE